MTVILRKLKAAAYDVVSKERDALYISTSRVEKRGPPPSTRITAKLEKQKRKTRMAELIIEGRSLGKVTLLKTVAGEAPSVRAASSSRLSMLSQYDETIFIKMGKLKKAWAIMIAENE